MTDRKLTGSRRAEFAVERATRAPARTRRAVPRALHTAPEELAFEPAWGHGEDCVARELHATPQEDRAG